MGLKGAANWFFVQAREELTHGQRFYNYMNRLGEHVVMTSIDQPPGEYRSLLHMFEETLRHEQRVTGMINDLATLANKENDHGTQVLLQWFVNEQIEEEENAKDIMTKLKMAGKDSSALLMIDNELATRAFVMPPDLGGPADQAGA